MSSNRRRREIIEILNRRRDETMKNLACEFGVSWLTIYRDIQELSLEYPIFTTKGNGGGVHLAEGFHLSQKYLNAYQKEGLERILPKVDKEDRAVIKSILVDFALPSRSQKSG